MAFNHFNPRLVKVMNRLKENLITKIDFDFHLSSSRIQAVNCNVASPVTYYLKEMEVLFQSEIR